MNKGSLATILGMTLLGLSKKGSSARRFPIDDFYKSKTGNEEQKFRIYFIVEYFPVVEIISDSAVKLLSNFEDEIDDFRDFTIRVGKHVIECDDIVAKYNLQEIEDSDYFDGTIISWFGEEWLNDGTTDTPLDIRPLDFWRKALQISNYSQIVIDFPENRTSPHFTHIQQQRQNNSFVAKGYLEVELNRHTINLDMQDFNDYLDEVLANSYYKWIQEEQNSKYSYFDYIGDIQIEKVEPNIFSPEKLSNLRKR